MGRQSDKPAREPGARADHDGVDVDWTDLADWVAGLCRRDSECLPAALWLISTSTSPLDLFKPTAQERQVARQLVAAFEKSSALFVSSDPQAPKGSESASSKGVDLVEVVKHLYQKFPEQFRVSLCFLCFFGEELGKRTQPTATELEALLEELDRHRPHLLPGVLKIMEGNSHASSVAAHWRPREVAEPPSDDDGSPGKHLSAEELRAVLMRGLPSARRFQWVRHLSGLCPRCLAALEQCAAQESKSGDHGVGQDDLVLLAVERMLVETNDGRNAEFEDLSPWLWLGLRQARRVPLGFCRLIVEESRFQAWSRTADAVELAEQALSIVKRSELAVHGRKLHQDVIARGHAYLCEAFRLTGNHIEAGRSFATAERHRRSGTGDRELEASVCELRSALARDQNDPGLAGRLLGKARSLLTGEQELERRLAVVLIAEGNALSVQGDRAGARTRYREAMQLLPPEAYPRLRLRVEHYMAFEKYRNGEYTATVEHLAQVAPLYERYADALLRAERGWVLGSIHLHQQRWQEAEEALLPALHAYLDLGYGHDAVRILLDLGTVYLSSNQPGKAHRFVRLLNTLRQTPEVEALILERLRKIHHMIAGSEAASALSKVIDALEARVEPPPN